MMQNPRTTRAMAVMAAVALSGAGLLAAQPAVAANDVIQPGDRLFVNPQSTTLEAAANLTGQARDDAQLLGSFPTANWFTKGSPAEVQSAVAEVVEAASADGSVPVLVAYNLPFRDCAQYSAGGATNTAEYNEWIDAFAAGIGSGDAVVILEPDGLGIIPWYTTINGELEWCQPAEADPATAASDRFVQLNHAVDTLGALASTAVYLDGTHSGWLGVGDASDRLIKAGVANAEGFFLNASNYVATERLEKYGKWISDCIHLSENSWWQAAWCGSQYYPANPGDFSTWGLTDAAYDQAFADTGLSRDPAVQAHYVIDTSRNGQGPWTPPEGVTEDWCNPPDRGAGLLPTTETGDALLDAYLWIKVPGESDGLCLRGTAGPEDPVRGMVNPAAGVWFPEQARELIEFAVPAIEPLGCQISYTPNGEAPSRFAAQLRVESDTAVDGWTIEWSYAGGEQVSAPRANVVQNGKHVTLTNAKTNASIEPGEALTLALVGSGERGSEPLLFTLNGEHCTSN